MFTRMKLLAPSASSGPGNDDAARNDSAEVLPQHWSDTDQRIFECLLLAQPHEDVTATAATPPLSLLTGGSATDSASDSASVSALPAAASPPTTTTKTAARRVSAAKPTTAASRRKKATASGGSTSSGAHNNSEDAPLTHQQQQQHTGAASGKTPAAKKHKPARRRASIDERKFKHREVQRRFMARKKESIARVKRTVAGLEAQFRLLELSNEKTALEHENAALRDVGSDAAADVQSLEQLKLLFEDEKQMVGRLFEPVTLERWHELVQRVMQEVNAQATDPSFRSAGFSVLGWSDRRKIEDSAVQFTFSKFFPHIWAEELLNRTWDKVTTESYASFFSPALHVMVHLLQRVSSDAIIVYRAICNPSTGRISRSVELIGRVRRERDFVLFIRSFDGAYDVHERVGEPTSWSRSVTILRFEPTSMTQATPGCIVHSGGVYGNFVTGGVQHWLMEVLFLVLRFESAMIAPIFMLCDV